MATVDELNPRNRLKTTFGANDDNEEMPIPEHDELDTTNPHPTENTLRSEQLSATHAKSDMRRHEGLLTAEDETALSSVMTDELTPITHHTDVTPSIRHETAGNISAADSGTSVDSDAMLSTKSSLAVYDSATEDF